jgi:dihydroneopterin triphosphate diphosphatase
VSTASSVALRVGDACSAFGQLDRRRLLTDTSYTGVRKMREPYSVQVFLVRIVDAQRSYLLLHRIARPELGLPEFWQGVSGALEAGEERSAAACREVVEETGIQLDQVCDTGFEYTYPVRAEWRRWYGLDAAEIRERVFFAIVPASVTPVLSSEHQAWRWCSPAEAANLLTFGRNADGLRAVEAWLAASPPGDSHCRESVLLASQ